ncbi:hypothetical protein [Pseudonocardia sp.]|jgi:uncharacterized cupredoxin-like copper-binding protein|uniref:hypothetical protein n=1 Tax=Pseudonocardia sp. TaxID=60912 RepID=UPI00260561B3|nr:hypothetical protein [Pseudonocardia sp.]MCW2720914.1 hypothetical protein [Pseudonocardia sp.]MDT7618154.1 hypothetical protein [Pseudonocardiales bacterium]
MNRKFMATALGGVAVAALAGCAVPGPGMMNGSGDSGHVYSRSRCGAPSSLPGQTVTVMLADAGMGSMMGGTGPLGVPMMLRSTPSTVVAGRISLVAQNMGWRSHELLILPLSAGSPAGRLVTGSDGRIDEAGALGEASASCAADSGDGITSGSVGWTTMTLPIGRYELVCNLANHYADGMRQEFDVTAG